MILRDLLAETASRVPVRVLLWGGAPLPLYPMSRKAVRAIREALCAGNEIVCALDTHERPMHCHHEKLVIVDDELAFVGGIDLTDFAGNRLDRPGHPPRGSLGWHDVATVLRGPVVGAVARHFNLRWKEAAGEHLPAPTEPGRAGDEKLQIVRTVPERVYDALPRGEFSILGSYAGALRSAEHLVYLENQFLWSAEIVEILREKLSQPAERPLPRAARAARQAELRRGRHHRTARPAHGRRRRRRPDARLYALRSGGRLVRSRLRARQGGNRGRPLAHGRIGEPERALALQRHRGERRQPQPRARPQDAAPALGRAPRPARRDPRRATPRRSSTTSGDRSPPSSSSDGRPARRSRTASWAWRTSRAARSAYSGRFRACSSTADAEPRRTVSRSFIAIAGLGSDRSRQWTGRR